MASPTQWHEFEQTQETVKATAAWYTAAQGLQMLGRDLVTEQTTEGLYKMEIKEYTSSQFSSVAQSCPTLCVPMDSSTPGLPVHHQLLEPIQTHVH